jgi:hypothetical protein
MGRKTHENLKISANEGNTFCYTTESGSTPVPFSSVVVKSVAPYYT